MRRREIQHEEKPCLLEDLVGHRVRGLIRDCDVFVADGWGPFAKVLRFQRTDAPGSALFYRERPGGNPIFMNLAQSMVAAEDLGIYRMPDEPKPDSAQDEVDPAPAERRL